MTTPKIDTEQDGLLQTTKCQLVPRTRHEDKCNVIRVAIALTLDVTIDDQTATPSISNIAVLSATV